MPDADDLAALVQRASAPPLEPLTVESLRRVLDALPRPANFMVRAKDGRIAFIHHAYAPLGQIIVMREPLDDDQFDDMVTDMRTSKLRGRVAALETAVRRIVENDTAECDAAPEGDPRHTYESGPFCGCSYIIAGRCVDDARQVLGDG